MKSTTSLIVVFLGTCCFAPNLASAGKSEDNVDFPRFRMQEIYKGFEVGYAVKLVDVNGDGKPDIVVVDSKRVVWYENPTWKMHTIIKGQTQPDNVCIDAYDIDGDGKIDFALGAGWNPGNTLGGGTLQWLKRGKTLDEEWSIHPIDSEPTVHRIRFADIDGTGKPKLLVVPLFGKGSTGKKNHMDAPLRVLAYAIPKNPLKDRWVPEVLDQSLHVAHNFAPIPAGENRKGMDILMASYEGVNLLHRSGDKWLLRKLGEGNQAKPNDRRGASEIKQGKLKNGRRFIATIEPWHGHQVVVYTEPQGNAKNGPWNRHVIDEELLWGHAVWCADLDGDGSDELIIGVRDDLDQKDHRRGVRIYKALDERGTKWARHIIDNGGMACEDLAAVDLDGDGRIDIVAVGRQTHNARIYWNLGHKKN
jgi:hypothetical protein